MDTCPFKLSDEEYQSWLAAKRLDARRVTVIPETLKGGGKDRAFPPKPPCY